MASVLLPKGFMKLAEHRSFIEKKYLTAADCSHQMT